MHDLGKNCAFLVITTCQKLDSIISWVKEKKSID